MHFQNQHKHKDYLRDTDLVPIKQSSVIEGCDTIYETEVLNIRFAEDTGNIIDLLSKAGMEILPKIQVNARFFIAKEMIVEQEDFVLLSEVTGEKLNGMLATLFCRIDHSSEEFYKLVELCNQDYQVDFLYMHGGRDSNGIWSLWNYKQRIASVDDFVSEYLRNSDNLSKKLLIIHVCNPFANKLAPQDSQLPIFYPLTVSGPDDLLDMTIL